MYGRAELGWRLGLALAAINFVVLGLAVASVNPRAARSTSLVFALFAFIVYYNLMTLGQSWVGAGRLGLADAPIKLASATSVRDLLTRIGTAYRRPARLLPVPYFLVTFTVPEGLRAVIRSQQKVLYAALFAQSAGALVGHRHAEAPFV